MRLILLLLLLAGPARGETVIAARTLRAQSLIAPGDVVVAAGRVAGAYGALDEVIGLEARNVLYAGRPVMTGDLGPPAIIERNQVVPVVYDTGAMRIVAEGRALGRAGIGDTLRVMNLSSHAVVTGRVLADGSITVGPPGAADPIAN